jgi:hypothetical protein
MKLTKGSHSKASRLIPVAKVYKSSSRKGVKFSPGGPSLNFCHSKSLVQILPGHMTGHAIPDVL